MCIHENCDEPGLPLIIHDLCEEHYRAWVKPYFTQRDE